MESQSRVLSVSARANLAMSSTRLTDSGIHSPLPRPRPAYLLCFSQRFSRLSKGE